MAFSIPNDFFGGMEGSNQGLWKMGAGWAGGWNLDLIFVAVKHKYVIFGFIVVAIVFCYGKSS